VHEGHLLIANKAPPPPPPPLPPPLQVWEGSWRVHWEGSFRLGPIRLGGLIISEPSVSEAFLQIRSIDRSQDPMRSPACTPPRTFLHFTSRAAVSAGSSDVPLTTPKNAHLHATQQRKNTHLHATQRSSLRRACSSAYTEATLAPPNMNPGGKRIKPSSNPT